jgi:hypothetical protein
MLANLRRALLWSLVVLVFVACQSIGFDGDTYSIELANASTEQLTFLDCGVGDCDDPLRTRRVDAGDSINAVGTVDVFTWWQVRNLESNVLGCFLFDFEERPSAGLSTNELDECP